jgi:hypothetical protein
VTATTAPATPPLGLRPPLALFTLLNVLLVWSPIALVLNGMEDIWFHYAWSLIIILLQGALYGKARTFFRRLLLFYGGFVLFCWGFTLHPGALTERIEELPALVGLVLRGFLFVLFGHVYGFVLLVPVIAGINEWVWRTFARRTGRA